MRFCSQAKRGGVRGSHGAVSDWLPPVALWFFPASGKEHPSCPRRGQKNSRATRCSQKPTNSRITRAAPVPPGCQRTSDITPQVPSCRPREEAISLAQQEFTPTSQARRGPGAAMVLSRIGCHRAPFGSFPRVGKNNPHARATGKSPSRHQAQPKAHHFARNEGGPLVPPGRQRTTDITPKAVPSRPREEAISLAQHEVPPPKPSGEGSGGSHGAGSDWLPPGALWFFPASGKERPAHPRMCKGTPRQQKQQVHPRQRKGKRPCPLHGQGRFPVQKSKRSKRA